MADNPNSYYDDKYKLYRNKIMAINKIYHALYYGNILRLYKL